ncbi:hypothetical protein [Paremcibacter congregatus]|uniref:hypothetical protein n=1 Tax=Paremcibacter congregatus TaxID=2043170 RepID=UPI003A92FBC4
MKRDDISNMGVAFAIAPAALAADNTPGSVDLTGFDSASFLINVGVGGITFSDTNKIEFVMTHSDDDSDYSLVTDDDVVGVTVGDDGIVRSLVAAHAAATSTKVGYIGGKPFVKVLADFSGTHGSPTPISVPVVKTRAYQRPVS